jgi:hypothetical protein
MNPETQAAVKDMREAAEYRRLKPELESMAAKLAMWDELVIIAEAFSRYLELDNSAPVDQIENVLSRARALQVKP